jgi:hypothetical protein
MAERVNDVLLYPEGQGRCLELGRAEHWSHPCDLFVL